MKTCRMAGHAQQVDVLADVRRRRARPATVDRSSRSSRSRAFGTQTTGRWSGRAASRIARSRRMISGAARPGRRGFQPHVDLVGRVAWNRRSTARPRAVGAAGSSTTSSAVVGAEGRLRQGMAAPARRPRPGRARRATASPTSARPRSRSRADQRCPPRPARPGGASSRRPVRGEQRRGASGIAQLGPRSMLRVTRRQPPPLRISVSRVDVRRPAGRAGRAARRPGRRRPRPCPQSSRASSRSSATHG